ncbi:MAG: sulfite exporter TauE/SafE family protein [Cytophagaceae bacterium]|nr:sulfite exporter TauE/SafE family protein [Cytophagaceae bacterium]MDW8455921.1 sulfite exporter TauE/SafE family protein [Cytophagaceae bacterium]
MQEEKNITTNEDSFEEEVQQELGLEKEEWTPDIDPTPVKRKLGRSAFGQIKITKRMALVLATLTLLGGTVLLFQKTMPQTTYNTWVNILLLFTDKEFLIFCGVGFVAQMIDGALGMAYGASCTTMLTAYGVSNVMANQSLKISEVFTTMASGLSHWKMGNVNKKLFRNLIIPGVAGALLGSILIAYIDSLEKYGKMIKPVISLYIMFLGAYIIYKALRKKMKKRKTRRLNILAAFGGFMDAVGGGGWGPIVTSTLLSSGRAPKYTIGSVNMAEFFVAFTSACTLSLAIGFQSWKIIAGLIVGGIIAAPLGAFIAGRVKTKPLMLIVGTLIILVNMLTIYKAWLR